MRIEFPKGLPWTIGALPVILVPVIVLAVFHGVDQSSRTLPKNSNLIDISEVLLLSLDRVCSNKEYSACMDSIGKLTKYDVEQLGGEHIKIPSLVNLLKMDSPRLSDFIENSGTKRRYQAGETFLAYFELPWKNDQSDIFASKRLVIGRHPGLVCINGRCVSGDHFAPSTFSLGDGNISKEEHIRVAIVGISGNHVSPRHVLLPRTPEIESDLSLQLGIFVGRVHDLQNTGRVESRFFTVRAVKSSCFLVFLLLALLNLSLDVWGRTFPKISFGKFRTIPFQLSTAAMLCCLLLAGLAYAPIWRDDVERIALIGTLAILSVRMLLVLRRFLLNNVRE